MKTRNFALALAISIVAVPGALATSPESSSAAMTQGEIRKVDKEAKKITIKHQEIRSLQMPPMTMVFEVKNVAMLERVRRGDQVHFAADKIGGAYTVTRIDPAK